MAVVRRSAAAITGSAVLRAHSSKVENFLTWFFLYYIFVFLSKPISINTERICQVANHKSALKRARQNENRRLRNKATRTRVKSIVKTVRQSVGEGAAEASRDHLNAAKSVIAKAAKKGVIHKRTAARKVSRLTKLVQSIPS
jgi:small subunit ribosomal protein S20